MRAGDGFVCILRFYKAFLPLLRGWMSVQRFLPRDSRLVGCYGRLCIINIHACFEVTNLSNFNDTKLTILPSKSKLQNI
jgi:hypothetical protein